jgi:TRAP-type C4-dicarboxylate transport system substrate-binding protein
LAAIRFGGYQPSRSVHTRAARHFGEELARLLGSRADFRLVEDVTRAGRKAAELLAMTEGDELDICYFSSSYLVARVPSLGLFDLPFRFADRGSAYGVLDGETGRTLARDVAARTGFAVMGLWDNGFRHISNARHPIIRPSDCRDLRIRTLDNAMHQRVFRALGFEPVVIDVKDLAAAVAGHRVDAQENPLTNLVNFALHRTHRFVTLTGHFFGVALVLCNRARFDAWPADVRTAVAEAMAAATSLQRRFAAEEDDVCLAQLAVDGVEITRADQFDRPAFIAALADVRAAGEQASVA